jgi:hypothetical protein
MLARDADAAPSRSSRPGRARQAVFVCLRRALTRWRELRGTLLVDALLLTAAGAFVGLTQAAWWAPDALPQKYTMAVVAPALMMMLAFCRTFTADWEVLQRERDAGVSQLAVFAAHAVADAPLLALLPLLFLVPFWSLVLPRADFGRLLAALVGLAWAVSGLAYLISVAAPRAAVTLSAAFAALLFGVFLSGVQPSGADWPPGLLALSYSRWATEAAVLAEVRGLPPDEWPAGASALRGVAFCGSPDALAALSWSPRACDRYWARDLWALFGFGAVFRAATLARMALPQRQTRAPGCCRAARS